MLHFIMTVTHGSIMRYSLVNGELNITEKYQNGWFFLNYAPTFFTISQKNLQTFQKLI